MLTEVVESGKVCSMLDVLQVCVLTSYCVYIYHYPIL